ncbi:MAG: hypothetical protein ACFB3T_15410 [Geminicoccaceae bacterium]
MRIIITIEDRAAIDAHAMAELAWDILPFAQIFQPQANAIEPARQIKRDRLDAFDPVARKRINTQACHRSAMAPMQPRIIGGDLAETGLHRTVDGAKIQRLPLSDQGRSGSPSHIGNDQRGLTVASKNIHRGRGAEINRPVVRVGQISMIEGECEAALGNGAEYVRPRCKVRAANPIDAHPDLQAVTTPVDATHNQLSTIGCQRHSTWVVRLGRSETRSDADVQRQQAASKKTGRPPRRVQQVICA